MTFQAGVSGNPNGRPRGTGTRQKVFNTLVELHKEALFKVAIDMALKCLICHAENADLPSIFITH